MAEPTLQELERKMTMFQQRLEQGDRQFQQLMLSHDQLHHTVAGMAAQQVELTNSVSALTKSTAGVVQTFNDIQGARRVAIWAAGLVSAGLLAWKALVEFAKS